MANFYPIVAKVSSYDLNNELRTTHHPLYAPSLAAAVSMIEEHYGQDLEQVAVQYADCENTLFEIPEELATKYVEDGAFLDT